MLNLILLVVLLVYVGWSEATLRRMRAKVERLEASVTRLAKAEGVRLPDLSVPVASSALPGGRYTASDAVLGHLAAGRDDEAGRQVMTETGLGERDARDVIRRLRQV